MLKLMIVAFLGVAILGCVDERYDIPPDESWKPRNYYCWFFQVDPIGDDNNQVGWADEEPTLGQDGSGVVVVEAINTRVHFGLFESEDRGEEKEDYFRERVIWSAGENGQARVEQRC